MDKTMEEASSSTVDPIAGDNNLFPRGLHAGDTDAGVELNDLLRRPTLKGSVSVTCVDYDPQHYVVQEVSDLPD